MIELVFNCKTLQTEDTIDGNEGMVALRPDLLGWQKVCRTFQDSREKSVESHPRLFKDRLFAGELWSDRSGRYCCNQTAFSFG